MSRFEENRLFVLNDSHAPRLSPALAQEIGLNESILFLQLEFLIAVHGSVVSGRRWVRMSVRDLEREFPFWSYSTINRAVQSLEAGRLITVENFNRRNYDKTRWFSINLDVVAGLKSIAVKATREVRPVAAADEPLPVKQGGVETRSTQNETGSVQGETRSTQIETAIDRELIPETKPESTHTPPPAAITAGGMKQGAGVCVCSLGTPSSSASPTPATSSASTTPKASRCRSGRRRASSTRRSPSGWRAWSTRRGLKPRDTSGCPDCHGLGWWYPEGPAKGTARCKHLRLDAEGSGSGPEAVPP